MYSIGILYVFIVATLFSQATLDPPAFIMKDKREVSTCECVCREGERHRQAEREGESYNKDPPDIQAVLTCSISTLLLATQPGLCLLTHLPQATKGSRCEVVFRHTFRHELRRTDGNLAHIAGGLGFSEEKHLRS